MGIKLKINSVGIKKTNNNSLKDCLYFYHVVICLYGNIFQKMILDKKKKS